MTGSAIKFFVVMMLMIMLVVIQVECLSEPFCSIKCEVLCIGKNPNDVWDKCVQDCKEIKC